MNHQSLSAFIWSVADLLRGDYKQSDYGKVILPFTVLRRLDCVLEATKEAVLAEYADKQKLGINPQPFLLRKAGQSFYNTSPLDMKKLMGDQDHIKENLFSYIQGFSLEVRDIFERFDFYTQVDRLAKSGLLYQVTERFAHVDLHPETVSNSQMGLVFEELIRKFAEISNETAGEHFTPREVIKLMVNLLFIEDDDVLAKPGVVRTIYDPTAGTGGMLSVAGEYLEEHNPEARLTMFGQELNPESYAICKADMLIKGQDVANIVFGNTFSDDGHILKKFDYMLSNPPFGVEWKKVEKEIRNEHEKQGYNGRFGPGLPRVSDGSLLFLLHLISKMRPAKDGGSRFGIVLNGSPLFTGGAGSGESEIRRYVLENDLVEAIIGLPTDMFYNTGISTYVWILSNRKPEHRKGKLQLIDASGFWQKMRKSLGSKRKELSDQHIAEITRLFGQFIEASDGKKPISKIFKNSDFGYRTITVERPLKDENGKILLGEKGKLKGKPQPDSSLRDTENVPLSDDVEAYFKREVLPHAPDAWIDHDKTKVGYEIPFNRHFYIFETTRQLAELDVYLKGVTEHILTMLEQVSAINFPHYEKYKDSGIEWLGKIPDHWAIVPIKHLGRLKGGAGFPHNEQGIEGEELSFHKVNALAQAGSDGILLPSENTITRNTAAQLGAFIFPPKSIVFAKVGAALLLGRIRLLGEDACIDNNMMGLVVRQPEYDVDFIKYAMSLVRFDLIANPGAVPSLNEAQIGNFLLAIPKYEEQQIIATFLDRETTKIDALIQSMAGNLSIGQTKDANSMIALLQERRIALISAAVTGKIDVRGLVSTTLPEEAAA